MILDLKNSILITHSFYFNNQKMHGLSGHLFEIFDYYYILKKNKIDVKCLIPEIISKEKFKFFVDSHYNVNFDINDFYFGTNFLALKARKILIVDGNYQFLNTFKSKLLGEIFAFACGPSFFQKNETPNFVTFLADYKIYPNLGIDYTKKVLPHLKHIKGERPFAHITKNCRFLNENQIKELIKEYPNILCFSDYKLPSYNFTNKPITNFNFSKYIYTPIVRHFDCSPRLIIECQILNIPFKLWNIDYKDKGLERRLENYEQFILKDNDEICDILK